MTKFAQVGDFCPDETCTDYGKRQGERQHNIIKYGKTKTGRQRYKCKTCDGTFTETIGTIFYRCCTPEGEIIDTLALIAERTRISSLVRTKGHKEDTIIDWIRKAGQHAEATEEVRLSEYRLTRGQIDGLWAYVGNKGEKKISRDR
jgi:transposase-like protein